MASEKFISKRCNCRNPQTGAKLLAACPDLYRSDGAWHPNHGQWQYQLELPKTAAGKRRQLRRAPAAGDSHDFAVEERNDAKALLGLAGDDKAMRAEIATLLKSVKKGIPLPDRDVLARRLKAGVPAAVKVTVGEYLNGWINGRTIDEKTIKTYRSHITGYLAPHLGHLELARLTGAHIEAMFTAIDARNADIVQARASDDPRVRASVRGKRTVGAATKHRIKATLRKALNDAIRKDRLLEFNAATHVELPSGTRPKARVWTDGAVKTWEKTGQCPSPVMVWTPTQAGRFLDYVEEHDPNFYPIAALVLRRGPRRGEVAGLRTDQVDLADGIVTITHQIAVHDNNELVYKEVKTRNGDRIFAIDALTIADFTAYKTLRAKQKLAAGAQWPTTVRLRDPNSDTARTYIHVDPFFRQANGQPWHPDTISDRWERLARKAGLPPVGIHDGRHGAATYVKAAGGDLHDIKELLGHANITITSDTYTSLLQDVERELAERTAHTIPRGKSAA
jgi:integrase